MQNCRSGTPLHVRCIFCEAKVGFRATSATEPLDLKILNGLSKQAKRDLSAPHATAIIDYKEKESCGVSRGTIIRRMRRKCGQEAIIEDSAETSKVLNDDGPRAPRMTCANASARCSLSFCSQLQTCQTRTQSILDVKCRSFISHRPRYRLLYIVQE